MDLSALLNGAPAPPATAREPPLSEALARPRPAAAQSLPRRAPASASASASPTPSAASPTGRPAPVAPEPRRVPAPPRTHGAGRPQPQHGQHVPASDTPRPPALQSQCPQDPAAASAWRDSHGHSQFNSHRHRHSHSPELDAGLRLGNAHHVNNAPELVAPSFYRSPVAPKSDGGSVAADAPTNCGYAPEEQLERLVYQPQLGSPGGRGAYFYLSPAEICMPPALQQGPLVEAYSGPFPPNFANINCPQPGAYSSELQMQHWHNSHATANVFPFGASLPCDATLPILVAAPPEPSVSSIFDRCLKPSYLPFSEILPLPPFRSIAHPGIPPERDTAPSLSARETRSLPGLFGEHASRPLDYPAAKYRLPLGSRSSSFVVRAGSGLAPRTRHHEASAHTGVAHYNRKLKERASPIVRKRTRPSADSLRCVAEPVAQPIVSKISAATTATAGGAPDSSTTAPGVELTIPPVPVVTSPLDRTQRESPSPDPPVTTNDEEHIQDQDDTRRDSVKSKRAFCGVRKRRSGCVDSYHEGGTNRAILSKTCRTMLPELQMTREQFQSAKGVGRIDHAPVKPAVKFPPVCTDFNGVPVSCVGDVLQLWDFVTAFGKVLRIPPCPYLALELAVGCSMQHPIIDVLLIRLVYTILSDEQLIEEIDIDPDLVETLLKIRLSRRRLAIKEVLSSLPSFLQFERDVIDLDENRLVNLATILTSSEDRFSFYTVIDTLDRVLILRQLVDIACTANVVRECVLDSVEHAFEERKKVREDAAASRRKIEAQLKEIRRELDEYKRRHNVEIGSSVDEGDAETQLGESMTAPSLSASGVHPGSEVGPEQAGRKLSRSSVEKITRQQRLDDARRIRESERERRDIERGLETLESKAEKLRAGLRALRSARSRQTREVGKVVGQVSSRGVASSAANARPHVDNDCDLVRSYPLGRDRYFRVYWFFPDVGRVWIEDTTTRMWCYLKDKLEITMLQNWLSSSVKDEVELVSELTKYLPTIEAAIAKSERFYSTRRGLEYVEVFDNEDLADSAGESDVGDSCGDQAAAMRTNPGSCGDSSIRHRLASLSSSSNMLEMDRAVRCGRKSRVSTSQRHPSIAAAPDVTSMQVAGCVSGQKARADVPSNKAAAPLRRSTRGVRAAGIDAAQQKVAHDSLGTMVRPRGDRRSGASTREVRSVSESDEGKRRSSRLSRSLPLKRGTGAVTDIENVAIARRTRAKSVTAVT